MDIKSFELLVNRLDGKVKKFAQDNEFVASVKKILERVVSAMESDPALKGVTGIDTVSAQKNIEGVVSVYFQLVLEGDQYNYLMDVNGVQELTGKVAPRCESALAQTFPGLEFKVKVGVVPAFS